MLPRKSGLNVCRDIRQQGFATLILMLTARGQMADTVIGLKIGADDCLTKPFDVLQLHARIETVLRRAPSATAASAPIHEFGSIRVDFRRAAVLRDEKPVALSAREFQLLRRFTEHQGEALPRKELLKEVWGYSGALFARTVDVHVASLRRKLEVDPKHPQFIRTLAGIFKTEGNSTEGSTNLVSASVRTQEAGQLEGLLVWRISLCLLEAFTVGSKVVHLLVLLLVQVDFTLPSYRQQRRNSGPHEPLFSSLLGHMV
jgi:two-component system alkaline phosphatase synthesis response regulator PhoP